MKRVLLVFETVGFLVIRLFVFAATNTNFTDFTKENPNFVKPRHELVFRLIAPLMNFLQNIGLSFMWAGVIALLLLAIPFGILFSIQKRENFFREYFNFLKSIWWVLIFMIIGGIIGQMRYGK